MYTRQTIDTMPYIVMSPSTSLQLIGDELWVSRFVCLCFLLLFLVCVLGVVWWAACFFVRLPLTQVGVLVINAWPYPVKRDRILYSVVQTCDAWPNPEKAWHSPVWRNLILHDLILKAWSNPLDLIMQNVTRSCSAWPNHVKRGINVSY